MGSRRRKWKSHKLLNKPFDEINQTGGLGSCRAVLRNTLLKLIPHKREKSLERCTRRVLQEILKVGVVGTRK